MVCLPGGGLALEVVRLSPSAAEALAEIEAGSNVAPWSRKFFQHEFQNTYSRTYGARMAGRIAAFVVVHVVADEAHVVNLAVAPDWRRRGVASALLRGVVEDLRGEDIRWLYLEVRAGNAAARALYQRLGFCESGLRRRYYSDNGEDAVLMTLAV